MEILSIKGSSNCLYIQIKKNKKYFRVLTDICLEMGINDYSKLENDLSNNHYEELYSEVIENNSSVQVVVSKSQIHIIIKSPELKTKLKYLVKLIEYF